MKYLITSIENGIRQGVSQGYDAEAAYDAFVKHAGYADRKEMACLDESGGDDHSDEFHARKEEEQRASCVVEETPLHNDDLKFVRDNHTQAFYDDEHYPALCAALWRHQNGSRFFAPFEEDRVGKGSGATYVASINLNDGSVDR